VQEVLLDGVQEELDAKVFAGMVGKIEEDVKINKIIKFEQAIFYIEPF
jgi:hypothetical protein